MEDLLNRLNESMAFVRSKTDIVPEVALILGSGLGPLADEVKSAVKIPYTQIPHFPESGVVGHAGQLVLGTFCGKQVVAMQGRFHYYEGHPLYLVTYPVRVMKLLGAGKLIVTNAAGAVNRNFEVGDLMIITDHINRMYQDPLRGKNVDELGPRFPDMTHAYDPQLIRLAERIGENEKIPLRKGVYVASSGPCYETPAEVRQIAINGGDAAGMSTVPEVIVARHMGMRVLGISCLTNMAAGILDQPLSHEEVIDTTKWAQSKFKRLVKSILQEMH